MGEEIKLACLPIGTRCLNYISILGHYSTQLTDSYMAIRFLTLQRTIPSSPRLNVTTLVTPCKITASRSLSRLEQIQFHTSTRTMEAASAYRANGDNGDDGNTDGELNQWKFRAPYKVHENDPNFHVRYEGSCHCGKIKYQLSREKPLDAKFCHCTTCQKIHGMSMACFRWMCRPSC